MRSIWHTIGTKSGPDTSTSEYSNLPTSLFRHFTQSPLKSNRQQSFHDSSLITQTTDCTYHSFPQRMQRSAQNNVSFICGFNRNCIKTATRKYCSLLRWEAHHVIDSTPPLMSYEFFALTIYMHVELNREDATKRRPSQWIGCTILAVLPKLKTWT